MRTKHCDWLKRILPSREGFLLLEVMISIVIITTGILFIARSYASSKNALYRSTEIIKLSTLIGNKMFEYEVSGEIPEGEISGDFTNDENYSWHISAIDTQEESDLNQVTLEVLRKQNPKKAACSVTTYFRNKAE